MNKLEENRAVISEVDHELTQLFQKRFAAVRELADYKLEQQLPVLDRSREEALIASRLKELPEELQPYFRTWYEGLMAVSRQFQTDLINAKQN